MNKINVRAFAFGIFFAVSLIASYYRFLDNERLSVNQASQFLKNEGYVVLSQSAFKKLQPGSSNAVPAGNPATSSSDSKSEPDSEKFKESGAPSDQQKKVIAFQLEVTSGMNSGQISAILKSANIVDDAQDFEGFLAENGYSTKIQLGLFELTSEMDYGQIAKIITKS